MNGKGSNYRPVNRERFAANYDRIFGKKDPTDAQTQTDGQTPDQNDGQTDPGACPQGYDSTGDCPSCRDLPECGMDSGSNLGAAPESTDNNPAD